MNSGTFGKFNIFLELHKLAHLLCYLEIPMNIFTMVDVNNISVFLFIGKTHCSRTSEY